MSQAHNESPLTGSINQINLFSPDCTLYAPGLSLCFDTLSSWMVSVKAGQGDECSYLVRLVNSW